MILQNDVQFVKLGCIKMSEMNTENKETGDGGAKHLYGQTS